nr:hypothetical protein [Pseudomonas sp. Fl4BN1]
MIETVLMVPAGHVLAVVAKSHIIGRAVNTFTVEADRQQHQLLEQAFLFDTRAIPGPEHLTLLLDNPALKLGRLRRAIGVPDPMDFRLRVESIGHRESENDPSQLGLAQLFKGVDAEAKNSIAMLFEVGPFRDRLTGAPHILGYVRKKLLAKALMTPFAGTPLEIDGIFRVLGLHLRQVGFAVERYRQGGCVRVGVQRKAAHFRLGHLHCKFRYRLTRGRDNSAVKFSGIKNNHDAIPYGNTLIVSPAQCRRIFRKAKTLSAAFPALPVTALAKASHTRPVFCAVRASQHQPFDVGPYRSLR